MFMRSDIEIIGRFVSRGCCCGASEIQAIKLLSPLFVRTLSNIIFIFFYSNHFRLICKSSYTVEISIISKILHHHVQ